LSAAIRAVNPPALARPSGYSHGIVAVEGEMLHVAGQVGWDGAARIVAERFGAQFDQALANVVEVVRAAGGEPGGITRMRIYVTDLDEYRAARKEIGEAYRRRMGRHYPAMTLVQVAGLLEEGAAVEIEADAVVPRRGAP